jgi:phage gpG-like protein
MATTNQEKARRLAEKIAGQIARGAGKGLNAGRAFLVSRIKEALSVPAPRRAIRGAPRPGKKLGPIIRYVATTPARPGAPPRKLSGRLRTSVTSVMIGDNIAVIGTNARADPTPKYPGGFNYPLYHEIKGVYKRSGNHPFMAPTARKWRGALAVIIGRAAYSFIVAGRTEATP